ncbi:hypothetical protein [Lichenicoccus sp.]|uniref:hypothetical protein n=1 Tax=Lichenicoccus sp. TaxID=2781899 RepID=UPI003D13E5AD
MRFDYPGTGNSSDCDADDVWLLWQESIHDAVDWLRHHGLADRVVLCGLRAGATLAIEASATCGDVAGLLLLEPVLRGRSYLRQLAIEAGGKATDLASAGPLAVHELRLSAKTVERVSQIDLRRFRPAPSCPIGVFIRTPTKLLSECIAAWRETGAKVDSRAFDGLEAMLRPVLMSHTASIDASAILAWLGRSQSVTSVTLALDRLPAEGVLLNEAFMETSVRFGSPQGLFGILCEPVQRSAAEVAVVVTNSSGNPSYGFGRFGVELARSLAAAGIASLRMDFSGLGDSTTPDDGPAHIFEADRREELRSAIDLLTTRGYRRFATHGLCSGAYHVLHGAFADPRVSTLLLVNLQHFSWDNGDRVELKGYALRHPAHFLKKLGSRVVWVNLIRGKFDVAGIVAAQVGRLANEVRRLTGGPGQWHIREPAGPATITDQMQVLSLRARTLFLMSKGDEGIAMLSREFGPALEPPGAIVQIVADLDHALSTREMRQVAIGRIITFLENRTLSPQHGLQPLLEVNAA